MAEREDPYVSLRNPDFRWYVASLVAMTLGTMIQATVVAWQVYDITHDPLSLGLVGLAEALPFIAASLYAGHVADLYDRKLLSLAAIAVQTGCGAVLLAYTLRPAVLAGGRVWPIYAVVFASGLVRSFLQPARTALGAEIVPRETYANAVAWRSSLWQFAAVVGPAVGGLLYGFSGGRAVAPYAAETVLCAIGLVLFARVRYTRTPAEAVEELSIAENLTVGIRFLLRQPELLGAQVLDLFSVLFGGAPALLPIFASDILRVGPEGLGVLRAAPAAGAVVMSLVLAHRKLRNAGRTLFVCVAAFGLCWVFFALSHSFWLSLALLAISGMTERERGDPLHPAHHPHAGAPAGTGVGGEPDLHRLVERDRIVRVRRRRQAAGDGELRALRGIGDARRGRRHRGRHARAPAAGRAELTEARRTRQIRLRRPDRSVDTADTALARGSPCAARSALTRRSSIQTAGSTIFDLSQTAGEVFCLLLRRRITAGSRGGPSCEWGAGAVNSGHSGLDKKNLPTRVNEAYTGARSPPRSRWVVFDKTQASGYGYADGATRGRVPHDHLAE